MTSYQNLVDVDLISVFELFIQLPAVAAQDYTEPEFSYSDFESTPRCKINRISVPNSITTGVNNHYDMHFDANSGSTPACRTPYYSGTGINNPFLLQLYFSTL